MSCWVVPTLAAELWGIPLEQVLDEMRSGVLASKSEYGFTLVDVAPAGSAIAPDAGANELAASAFAPSAVAPSAFAPMMVPLTPPPAVVESCAAAVILSEMECDALKIEERANPLVDEPSIDELMALGAIPVDEVAGVAMTMNAVLPVDAPRDGTPLLTASTAATTNDGSDAAPRRRRGGRTRSVKPAPIELPAVTIDEDEMGPDPNEEPDDDKPLDWRAARQRASLLRRRPPPMRMAG